ncbi:MAG: 23S rRNA (pseudouridine(1915)-N(3))-methyltransferase RlmH [Clostridium sp.]|nr:23S rRNA (pseudouridine(1915)-N(3))-methyltransferase RlmH [Clostridium sp.]
MKISLVVVGRTQTDYISQGIGEYLRRLKHYIQFEIIELPDLRRTRSLTEAQQKEKEGEQILQALAPTDNVVLLDERGTQLTSRGFAEMLQQRMSAGLKRLVFVVGGPYGFSDAVYARADSKLSFSKMTFSHEMIRLFMVEQLYRAMTILRGEPYHHD